MEDYEKLLEQAYSEIKEVKGNTERFEIPEAEGHQSGKKTIITNFNQIANHLRRNPQHFQKFLLKTLGTTGYIEGERLVINGNISKAKINDKIKMYVEEFVLCKECKKPDTEIIKEGRLQFLHCLACGAKHPIKSV